MSTVKVESVAVIVKPETMKKIITVYDPPPIPTRNHDWSAYREGYDEGDPIGYGKTKEDAIEELKQAEES